MSTHASPARLAANRANATHSTGPQTTAGKEKSSRNAVTTALTGRTVLLTSDDRALYERHLNGYRQEFQPGSEVECVLVQAIADSDWRISRIPHLMLGLEAKAQEDLEEEYKHLDPELRCMRIGIEGFLKYEKQLRNLQLQESRLHRRREKDLAEFRSMQKERELRRTRELAEAAKLFVAAQHDNLPFEPADHGFDFATDEIQRYLTNLRAATLTKNYLFAPAKA